MIKKFLATLFIWGAMSAPALSLVSITSNFNSTTGRSRAIRVTKGKTFNYSAVGTFVQTLNLEQSLDGINWTSVIVSTTQNSGGTFSGTVSADAYQINAGGFALYSWNCDSYTSGSSTVTISENDDMVQRISNHNNAPALDINDASIYAYGSEVIGSTLSINGADSSGYSLTLSSGINAGTGTIRAAAFVGDGSQLSGISGGGGGSPGGSTTQIQYNNAGSFAGSSNFTFDGKNAALTYGITGTSITLTQTNSNMTGAGITQFVLTSSVASSGAFPGNSIMLLRQLSSNWYDYFIRLQDYNSGNPNAFLRADCYFCNFEMDSLSSDTVHGLGLWNFSIPKAGSLYALNSRAYNAGTFERHTSYTPVSQGGGILFAPVLNGVNGNPAPDGVQPLIWTSTDNHQIGIQGPLTAASSWKFTIPNTQFNQGQVMYQSGNGPIYDWEFTAGGATGRALTFNSGTAPTWSASNPVLEGSTMTETAQKNFTSGSPSTFTAVAVGSITFVNAPNHGVVLTQGGGTAALVLPPVASGKCLMSNGTSSDPSFQTCGSGSTTLGFASATITANQTGIGTSFTSVTGSTMNINVVTANDPVEVCFGLTYDENAVSGWASVFDIVLDGVSLGAGTNGGVVTGGDSAAGISQGISYCLLTSALGNGNHVLFVQVKDGAASTTDLKCAVSKCYVSAFEVGSSGAGNSVTATGNNTLSGNNTFTGTASFAKGLYLTAITNVSANYTAASSDTFIAVNASLANRTITLPSALTDAGQELYIVKSDTGANSVTINTAAGDLLSQTTGTWKLNAQGQYLHVISTGGTTWAMVDPLPTPGWVGMNEINNSASASSANNMQCEAVNVSNFVRASGQRINVGTNSGQTAVALYDNNGIKIAESTSTASGTGSVTINYSSFTAAALPAAANIAPGIYYICLAQDNATQSYNRSGNATGLGILNFSSSWPPPATITISGGSATGTWFYDVLLVTGGLTQ